MTENREPERFTGFSRLIDIHKLERESRKFLYLGFVFAVFFHALLSLYFAWQNPFVSSRRAVKNETEEKHIQVYLVPLPPKLINPFEVWKGPAMESSRGRPRFAPRMPGGSITYKPLPGSLNELKLFRGKGETYQVDMDVMIREIAASGILDTIVTYAEPIRITLPYYYTDLSITRKPIDSPNRISMKEEMLTVEDLDTGRFKGLVVMNAADEKDTRGYVHIPVSVWGDVMTPPASTRRAVEGLARALKTYSGIVINIDRQIYFHSQELLRYPIVYISADEAFDMSERETTNFAAYLRKGGFAIIEAYGSPKPDLPPVGAGPLKQMLQDALGSAGILHPIPNDHFLYHCYYDFDDGPPRLIGEQTETVSMQPASILEGVWIDDRLAAIYSEKKYGEAWSGVTTMESYQKIGVNMIVFALTQYGGLSLKLIDDSKR
ncbi:MAG: DUF4159 domain-containing protein [Candidatus Latescibacter sp.]|nr:DUF4159 domain-containing protein [Candidatus Latescibacter sp.]